MTLPAVFVSLEDVVCAWVKTTSVNGLVSGKVFLSAKGNPLPRVEMRQVGGAPIASDVPAEEGRIAFDCWSNNRPQAQAIVLALMSEIESLVWASDVVIGGSRIASAQVLSKLWLPDPSSDVSRYVLQARFTVLEA